MDERWLTTIYESTVHLVMRLRGGLFTNSESAQPHFADGVLYTEAQSGGGSNLDHLEPDHLRIAGPRPASKCLYMPMTCLTVSRYMPTVLGSTIVVFSRVNTQQLLLVTPTSGTRSRRMLLKSSALVSQSPIERENY
jgi:hypothetical protein